MTYKFVDTLTEKQIHQLVELYQKEFWSQRREYPDVVKMLKHSDIVLGLIDNNAELIGFTRVLTDFVYRATIYDVIIKSTYRNKGLGAKLMDAIVHHPQLHQVEQIALYCLPEMMPFYQRWGFTTEVGNLNLMYRYHHSHQDK
ncbi:MULTISPECIES: GNAT family N-acetyltransferase [Nostocales]|uniref:GNAT family N-acetyltransferase n=1 Tax=Nostocales TaxID=1161 RepID=UPI001689B3F7|nr:MULTISPECIES: GNAT family N-acetyltransferase [Nostocales]MBD2299074.1 GNAT family N-acetyltransferase [Nostoc sp. FACHB-190]MBD2488411.1 GNAT family N-acetyltransferase [Aulosira sp. FACHB-615]